MDTEKYRTAENEFSFSVHLVACCVIIVCTCLIEHARLPGLGTTGTKRKVDCRGLRPSLEVAINKFGTTELGVSDRFYNPSYEFRRLIS